MSLCWSTFLSSFMQLAVHMAAAWVPLCPGGQRAGKAKWKSGENRIFHSIKTKIPQEPRTHGFSLTLKQMHIA